MERFTMIPRGLLRDHRLSKNDLRVMMALYDCRNHKTGQCCPRRGYISTMTGIPETRISKTTSRLVELGWLKKEGKGGLSKASQYTPFWATDHSIPDGQTVTESVTVLPTPNDYRKCNGNKAKGGSAKNSQTVTVSVTRIGTDYLPIREKGTYPPLLGDTGGVPF